ncbi:MAG: ribosome biogenesis GTPase YlqF [Clostridiales bacterium]|nr:ribosome biogenesis GTPase YlqF [Clostridiales bacterium]
MKKNDSNKSEKSFSSSSINWYPGHMVKTKRKIQETLNLIDVVVELLDARIPIASKNPDIDDLIGNKNRVIVLNKCDLANDEENKKWVKYYNNLGMKCILVDSTTGKGIKEVIEAVYELNKEKNDKLIKSGVVNKSIKLAIVGIPNVGKSSFINKLVNKNIVKVGNRPGVTTSNQWVRVNKDILLLDTPGVLWPKFEEEIGLKLCFTGCIKDEIIDIETISYDLIELLAKDYKKMLYDRYKLEDFEYEETMELLDKIAQKRGCIISGGRIDYTKLGHLILDEFQVGKIGKITLEKVDEINV